MVSLFPKAKKCEHIPDWTYNPDFLTDIRMEAEKIYGRRDHFAEIDIEAILKAAEMYVDRQIRRGGISITNNEHR